jgi:hypothetical protein
MTMIIDKTTASRIDAHDPAHGASGPTLLTEEEIALVGGGITNSEIPYIEGALGVGLALGSGGMAGAILTGAVLVGAPVLAGVAVAGCVVGAAAGLWLFYDALNGGSLKLA